MSSYHYYTILCSHDCGRNRKKVTLLDDNDGSDQVSLLGSIGASTSQSSLQLNLPTSSRPRTTPLSALLDEINSTSSLPQFTPTKTAPLVAVREFDFLIIVIICLSLSGDKVRAHLCCSKAPSRHASRKIQLSPHAIRSTRQEVLTAAQDFLYFVSKRIPDR